jgi:hypothetical protein
LTWHRGAVALLGACLSFVDCRQIIGIEGAEVDPSLAGRSGAAQPDHAVSTAGADAAANEESVGAGGDAGEPRSVTSLCEQYCSAVTSNCTGAFAVYTSFDTCLAVCVDLPAGQPGDSNVNSVQCRLHAALIARDEVPHYCPIAGPGGNGECGTNCEGLCALRAQVCARYADVAMDSCLSGCAKLDDLGTYSTDPSLGQYGGAHVQCRLLHVAAAAADDPEEHCSHADGAPPCR